MGLARRSHDDDAHGRACMGGIGLHSPKPRRLLAHPPGACPSPVGPEPKLIGDVIQRNQIPHVYGDRVVEVLRRWVCTQGFKRTDGCV